jgi:hypothetical protein
MNWKGWGQKSSGPNLRHYSICLEGLRKIMKIITYESWIPGRYLNAQPPEYGTGSSHSTTTFYVIRIRQDLKRNLLSAETKFRIVLQYADIKLDSFCGKDLPRIIASTQTHCPTTMFWARSFHLECMTDRAALGHTFSGFSHLPLQWLHYVPDSSVGVIYSQLFYNETK